MAGYRAFEHQYISKENMMRAKFALIFPNQDLQVFETRFIKERKLGDASGRGINYDERRFLAENATWMAFWPGEEFPGTRPPSEVEISQSNLQHAQDQPHNNRYHVSRGGQIYGRQGGPRRGPGRESGQGGARSRRGFVSHKLLPVNRGGGGSGRAYSSGDVRICRHWLRGYCKSGDACRFVHPPLKETSKEDGARQDDSSNALDSSCQGSRRCMEPSLLAYTSYSTEAQERHKRITQPLIR